MTTFSLKKEEMSMQQRRMRVTQRDNLAPETFIERLANNKKSNATRTTKRLLPLNGAGGFGANIVNDAVDTGHFVDNPG